MLLFAKNLLFTVLVPGTVAFYLPYSIGSRHAGSPEPSALLLAGPLLVAGAAIYLWCLWDFAMTGRGTPAPIDPPTRLVVRGLYRYVRNPMYVGVLTAITGWLVVFRQPAVLAYGLVVATIVGLFVRLVEEPQLRRRFGESYVEYCRHVPRWLPRVPPDPPAVP
jgi:protein-S-isoprenylcysteine O-methyltransferase Ste14